jgi:hypothetical protein
LCESTMIPLTCYSEGLITFTFTFFNVWGNIIDLVLLLHMWYPTSEASIQSQGFMSSVGHWPVVRVLGRQTQKWARVTRNKTVRAVEPKVDNIQQVRSGCYIWYQSRERLILRWGDCDIPHRKRASRTRALWVVLVANLLYVFWGVKLRSGLASPGTKPWGR